MGKYKKQLIIEEIWKNWIEPERHYEKHLKIPPGKLSDPYGLRNGFFQTILEHKILVAL